jgi:hypothetical protein
MEERMPAWIRKIRNRGTLVARDCVIRKMCRVSWIVSCGPKDAGQ